jgi:hypothetical protein
MAHLRNWLDTACQMKFSSRGGEVYTTSCAHLILFRVGQVQTLLHMKIKPNVFV